MIEIWYGWRLFDEEMIGIRVWVIIASESACICYDRYWLMWYDYYCLKGTIPSVDLSNPLFHLVLLFLLHLTKEEEEEGRTSWSQLIFSQVSNTDRRVIISTAQKFSRKVCCFIKPTSQERHDFSCMCIQWMQVVVGLNLYTVVFYIRLD